MPRRPSPVPKRPASPARWEHDGSHGAAAAARIVAPRAAAAAAPAQPDQRCLQQNGTAPPDAAAQHMTAEQKAAQLIPDSLLDAPRAAGGGGEGVQNGGHRRHGDRHGAKRSSRRAELEAPRAADGAKRGRSSSPVPRPREEARAVEQAAAAAASSRWILRGRIPLLQHAWWRSLCAMAKHCLGAWACDAVFVSKQSRLQTTGSGLEQRFVVAASCDGKLYLALRPLWRPAHDKVLVGPAGATGSP